MTACACASTKGRFPAFHNKSEEEDLFEPFEFDPDRFKAAIPGAGESNWTANYALSDISRTKDMEFFGPPGIAARSRS